MFLISNNISKYWKKNIKWEIFKICFKEYVLILFQSFRRKDKSTRQKSRLTIKIYYYIIPKPRFYQKKTLVLKFLENLVFYSIHSIRVLFILNDALYFWLYTQLKYIYN